MDWKRIAPWNWFKHEEPQESRRTGPFDTRTRSASADEMAEGLAGWTGHLFTGRGDPTQSGSNPMFASRPAVDISEGRKSYRVRVDLPGIEKEDLSVTVEGNTLAVFAHRREEVDEEEEGRHWVETSYGSTRRILSLPADADPESIRAKFRNGVLDIRIGKHPTRVRSTREVEIATG